MFSSTHCSATSWAFSSSRPISVEFRKDQLTIAIRGRRFTEGERVISTPIRIAGTYRVEKVGGGTKLTRVGDVSIDFIGRTTLNARQIASMWRWSVPQQPPSTFKLGKMVFNC